MAKIVLDKGGRSICNLLLPSSPTGAVSATNMLGRTPLELAATAVGKDEAYKEIKEFLTLKAT
jgi:hypothetical protein